MSLDPIVTSVVLYGNTQDTASEWLKWYWFAERLLLNNALAVTHLGLDGEEFTGKAVREIRFGKPKMLKSLKKAKHFNAISLYACPRHFQSIAFDFLAMAIRNADFVSITADKASSLFDRPLERMLREFIDFERGEIFEMSRREFPLGYIGRLNAPEHYQTLKVIERF